MKYKAEVKVDGEWYSNALEFDIPAKAEEYAKDLHERWLLTTDYRVINALYSGNHMTKRLKQDDTNK